jgi:hypothetical protein
VILLFTSTVYPETIHVPTDMKTIQEGINKARNGDTVLVAPGRYQENINFHGKSIIVASHYVLNDDPKFIKNTIIDGGHPNHPDAASCVLFVSGECSDAVLQGFTLINGAGTIRTEPNGTSWREGGGIMIRGSSPTIRNNLILKNAVLDTTGVTSTGGGGISCVESNPNILNNIIALNQARYAAGIMGYRSGIVLRNNIICQNSGGQDYGGGGVVMEGNGPGPKTMENNTIIANAAFGSGFYGGRAGGLLVFKTSITASNNIIWGNIQNNGGQIYIHHELTTADFLYNNIEGGWEGEGNIQALPRFSKRNFHLLEDSPCVDAGSPDSSYNDPASSSNQTTADNPARGGLRNDMGAYGGPGSTEMTIPDFSIPEEPYSGSPFPIPGRIEAEAFNWDSTSKSFYDVDMRNQGGFYRFSGVDIETCDDFGGGYSVSHIQKGEWLNYTVYILASEKYDLALRVASEGNSGCFHIECDGGNLTGTVNVPDTGGKKKWQRITIPDISLPSGKHVIRFVCEEGGFSLNAILFSFASSTLPEQWQNQDIGDVSEAGNAGIFDDAFYIGGSGEASGHVYYNDADELHFVYKKLSGDMEIIARILTHTYTHEWGKTGVMIRETLDDKSKYAMVGITNTASPVLYRREKTGERSDLHSWLPRTGYNWLKLTRIGDTFSGFKSKDGKTWIELEENAIIQMADTVYIGLGITSNEDGIISTATFDSVKVKQLW